MSTVVRGRLLRWSAVTAGVGVLVAVPVLLGAAPVPSSDLAPQQVVAAALGSDRVAWSGLAEVDGHLGLPALPFLAFGTQQLDQSNRVRTWWASPTDWRTDSLSSVGQLTQLPTDGGTVTYDSQNATVTAHDDPPGLREPRTVDLVPAPAARTLLAWAGPKDAVTALPSRRVAGIAAAGARVTPGDARSGVGHLDVWVDPASGLPLAVEVYARGSGTPSFSSRLLDVSLDRPTSDELHPRFGSDHWIQQRRDLLAQTQREGRTAFPSSLGGLPALQVDGSSAGLAVYGAGYVRLVVLQVPGRFSGRLSQVAGLAAGLDLAGVTVVPRMLVVDGAPVALLGGPLLQVAVVQGRNGALYALAGTFSADGMDAYLRTVVPTVRGWGAR